ncbi:alpha/beta fold hydrolase [Rhizobium halophytocola]|uniref:Pimeloyl-ACP methyl ester carboxylesterase n=1 Tax=Rhizobium halophytocola TaxID=735519 RepID=A0ABS4DTE6_9HYPH|nr:alpha/beta hydrolase [Rhizobium halophytocola]MBP1848964.1 pimeloyl-ACP methyl ester carboxylesterase [Rhizobium halophytocola]
MSWNVDNRAQTAAGSVAWGSAGDGQPLVLAHGWPWSSFSWHRVIPALSPFYKVHWFDMPGYGRSDKTAGQPTSLDVQGAVFAEMLSVWGLASPLVCAHDFGGAVTLRAHLLHGCDFDSLLLMNVVALSPWGSAFFDHVGRHRDAFTGLPPHIHAAVVEAYIKGALVNDLDSDDLAALVAPWLGAEGQASFYSQFAQADDRYTDEIADRFGDIRCPVTVIWGEDDPWIPVDRGRTLATRLPGSGFSTLSGVGHMPQLEAPDTLLHLLASLPDDFPKVEGH